MTGYLMFERIGFSVLDYGIWNPFHLLFPDVHLLKSLQWAHFPVVNAEGTFSGAASAHCSRPRLARCCPPPAFHSPLAAWPILLWAPRNSASCAHSGGMTCTGLHSCMGTPCISGDIAQGHFLLTCPPLALSAESASSLQGSLIPVPMSLHLFPDCLWAAWGWGLCLHLCICSP